MTQSGLQLEVKRVIKFDNASPVKAYCDLLVNEAFLIKRVRVVNSRNGLFVSMPRHQGQGDRWADTVEMLTKEVKAEVGRLVLEAYEQNEPTLSGK
jgi:stage V sporulation protein G